MTEVRRYAAICAALFGVCVAPAALADRALVLGDGAPGAGLLQRAVPEVDGALRGAGFDVLRGEVATASDMRAALSEVADGLRDHDRVVFALSGQVVSGGGRNWLLAEDAAKTDLARVGDVGLSLETVLSIAGQLPGSAVVALGITPSDTAPGDGLDSGFDVDARSIPQGVTVVWGGRAAVARFVTGPMLVEGQSMAASVAAADGIEAAGYLSSRTPFLPLGAPRPVAPPDTAEVERTIWESARAQDTVAAYEGYLARYPSGDFAEEAAKLVEEIRNEPRRAARLAEEGLSLTRPQRREIQRNLTLLEFNPRGVDGIFGPGTRGAVERYQGEAGFPVTGYLTALQIERLALQARQRQAEIDAEAERRRLAAEAEDRATWAATGARGDEAGLRTYLRDYPEGLFAATARAALAEIEAERRAEAEALDRQSWANAQASDDISGYRAYVLRHPEGLFVAEARARIAELEAPPEPTPEPQPDPEPDPDPVEPDTDATAEAERDEAGLGLTQVTRLLIEQRLVQLGANPGTVDGSFDEDTRAAIAAYQRGQDLDPTGYMNADTLSRMLAGAIGLPGLGGD